MTLHIVSGKAEIVAVIRIYSKPQQLALNARACEAASGILIVSIGKIPEKIIASHIQVVYDGWDIQM
jgi:hypothetical protein